MVLPLHHFGVFVYHSVIMITEVYGSDSSWNRPLYAIWFGGRVNASLEYKMLTLPEIVLALPTLYVLFGGMGWCDIESDWCSTEFSHS